MPILDTPKVSGLEFHYDGSPQRSPQWLAIKRGRIGASKLEPWLSVSSAKGREGTPLKARLDYEKQLMFERQFNTNFETYVNSAMQEGNEFEDWAARQYEQILKVTLEEVGCWYNEFFCASPDRKVANANAGTEIKVFKDNSFTDVMDAVKALRENDREVLRKLSSTVYKNWVQIQGQLWATGWDYIDYVPINFNSRKVIFVRITPDKEFHEFIAEKVQEPLTVNKYETGAVHDIIGEIPVGLVMANEDIDINSNGGW